MKIAFKHIQDRLEENPSVDEFSKVLFQLGHEHEIHDEIFDMEITPNRGDCLSLEGILRDVQFFYKVRWDKEFYAEEIEKFEFDFNNKSDIFCPKITFLKINVDKNVSDYKGDLKNYFDDLKIDKKNFFTDVSNFLMYETGQPTHCYDENKITGNVSLQEINKDMDFKTLLTTPDGSEYKKIKLSDKNQVFIMNNEVINLAGVVGGANTACSNTEDTTSILLECAYFSPEQIMGKSVKYDINSDAAHKFERGVDISCHDRVLRRFIKIIQDHVQINDLKIFSSNTCKENLNRIPFDVNKINRVIGIDILEEEYERYLHSLGFILKEKSIVVPSYRTDVRTQNDLAEEVARLIGYDNIPSKKINININNKNFDNLEDKVKSFLVDNGFYEVINSPFVDSIHNDKNKHLTVGDIDHKHNSIVIDNPLDSNKKYLRNNVLLSLINNMAYNENRQKDSIKLFEISEIYTKSIVKGEKDKIKIKKKLSIIASGRVGKNYRDFSKKINVNHIKDIFNDAFPDSEFNFHEISRKDLNLAKSKLKNDVVYIEINLDEFPSEILNYKQKLANINTFEHYVPVSEFPSSTRDISYLIKLSSKIDELQEIIFNHGSKILKEVFIFDFYNNQKSNEVKMGFRFIFQSSEKTLTDDDIDSEMDALITKTLKIGSVEIPGLNKK